MEESNQACLSRLKFRFSILVLVDDDDYFLIIKIHLKFDKIFINNIDSYKKVCLETLADSNDNYVRDASPKLEEGVKSIIDELKEINLGTIKDPCLTSISIFLDKIKTNDLLRSILKFKDFFALIYEYMHRLSLRIVIHKLEITSKAIPINQALKCM